jgi:hypothetical protein
MMIALEFLVLRNQSRDNILLLKAQRQGASQVMFSLAPGKAQFGKDPSAFS